MIFYFQCLVSSPLKPVTDSTAYIILVMGKGTDIQEIKKDSFYGTSG